MAGMFRWGLAAIVLSGIATELGAAQSSAGGAPPALTISKETTYVTGPLRKDGYVDYVAALDMRYREGVTPQNNAAVLLWQALGPELVPARLRETYFRALGIPVPPEKGNYYVSWNKYCQQSTPAAKSSKSEAEQEKAENLLTVGMAGPWSANDRPLLAQWLAANEASLALFVEASRRPRRYDPLIGQDAGMLIAVILPGIQQHREAAWALRARAMLKLGAGQIEGAWEDLSAIHRLGRLSSQGATLIDSLVGIALEAIACAGDRSLIEHGRLTAAQATRIGGELTRLPPAAGMAEKIDVGERFMFLDCVSTVAREGLATLNKLDGPGGGGAGGAAAAVMNAAGRMAIDWDLVARRGNSWYDRIAAAYRLPTRAERKAALQKIDLDVRELSKNVKDLSSLALGLLGDPRRTVSERIGAILVGLLTPALSAAADSEDRDAMQLDLVRLGFALAAYRADHGQYPAQLATLAPKYLEKIPKDRFAAGDLRYQLQAGGAVVYSVGVNGKDDGGKGQDDRKGGEPWDDLAIRLPAAR